MTTEIVEYPEHEKLKLISKETQACGEFIDWLQEEKGICLCVPGIERASTGEWRDDPDGQDFRQNLTPIRKLLAEFFDIDEDKLEAEKRAMLDALRAG